MQNTHIKLYQTLYFYSLFLYWLIDYKKLIHSWFFFWIFYFVEKSKVYALKLLCNFIPLIFKKLYTFFQNLIINFYISDHIYNNIN